MDDPIGDSTYFWSLIPNHSMYSIGKSRVKMLPWKGTGEKLTWPRNLNLRISPLNRVFKLNPRARVTVRVGKYSCTVG